MLRKVSNAEYTVLKLLWKSEDALSVAQIAELMERENQIKWAYTTAGTVMRRMEAKGYVQSVKMGSKFFYTPVLQRDEVLPMDEFRKEADAKKAVSVIEKSFQGSFSKFLSAFSGNRKLTREEFEDLKAWVKQHDDDY